MSSFLTEVEGFTPVIDVVVQDVGLMPALVYGRVWRYCQMEDKICKASLETISRQIGVSRKTVERHIKALCEKGYLSDKTPEIRNAPHIYADTGKARIVGLLAVRSGKTESPTISSGQTESPSGSDSKSEHGKTKSPMKIVSKDSKEDIMTSGVGEKDYLDAVVDFAKKMDRNDERPAGWREATDDEYQICKRVADLWTDSKLAWASEDIEKHLTASNQLLKQFGGNVRELLWTIDEFHVKEGNDLGFMVSGPYSLRNAIPAYVANREKEKLVKGLHPGDQVTEQDGKRVVKVGR